MSKEIKSRIKEIDARLTALEEERAEAEDRDWSIESKKVLDKIASEFSKGWDFISNAKVAVVEDLHVISVHGRVRNLWRIITGKPALVAAAQRRGPNALIQGFASEMGMVTASLIMRNMLKTRTVLKIKLPKGKSFRYCRAVHDANYYTVPYEVVIPAIHIIQHTATTGVSRWYKKVFGISFIVDPEIEMDIGANDADAHTWDWSFDNLVECMLRGLMDQIAIKRLAEEDMDSTVETILKPWVDKTNRAYLQKHYPLLDVPNLDNHIEKFIVDLRDWESRFAEYRKKDAEKKAKK